jgi:hypothetical protein
MSTYYKAKDIREQVTPAIFLAKLGHFPAFKSGKELYYLSMLRKENSASFCIDDKLGIWYDHGGANPSGITGGNVIDLALAYWHPLSFSEVITKIGDLCLLQTVTAVPVLTKEQSRPRTAIKVPHYQISEVKELGNNPAITAYLRERGIWSVAHDHLKEVYYYVEDEKKLRKHFFSAGWENENKGWELSNPYFKRCLGHKGLTLIPLNPGRVAIFESMIDYLSWKFEKEEDHSVIVLNGVTMVEAAIKRASSFSEKELYLDNDKAGIETTVRLLTVFPDAINGANHYAQYKDYNEMLVSELDRLCRVTPVDRAEKESLYYNGR